MTRLRLWLKNRKCVHCGGPNHPGWVTCEQCYDTVQTQYLDRPCQHGVCPHRVEAKL